MDLKKLFKENLNYLIYLKINKDLPSEIIIRDGLKLKIADI